MPIGRLKQVLKARLGERGGLLHSVGTLVGGTAFAQGLAVLALPLLTRLYTPAEFSVLAVYASLLGILTVVACLRLEIAIPLPECDEDAANLLALSLASGLILSLFVALGVLLFHVQIAKVLHVPAIAPYMWLIPVGMWLASAYAAFQFWSTRNKKFSLIARTRMTQALGGRVLQVIVGVAGGGAIGLIVGHMLSGGAGFAKLAFDAWKKDKKLLKEISCSAMLIELKKYSKFPRFSTLEALSNTAGSQLPIIFIAAMAVGQEAGFLMLASRAMAAPMSLIGGSLSQVYLAHAAEERRMERLGEFTGKIFSALLKSGVGPLIFAGIVAPPVSSLVFGDAWGRTGEIISILVPWYILQFMSSPVSMVLHVCGRQKLMLMIQVAGCILRVGVVLYFAKNYRDFVTEAYAVSGALFYGFCCVFFYNAAGVRFEYIMSAVKKASHYVLCWVLAAVVVRLALLAL